MTEGKLYPHQKLAEALKSAGLHEMAEKAKSGFYHDFLSPLDFPSLQLDTDLVNAIQGGNTAAALIRKRHHGGEWDATMEESEEWAQSEEGQDAMRRLLSDK